MSEISTEDFVFLTDVAIELDSAVNLLDAWAEKNCILEASLIIDRIKPKVKAFNEFIRKH